VDSTDLQWVLLADCCEDNKEITSALKGVEFLHQVSYLSIEKQRYCVDVVRESRVCIWFIRLRLIKRKNFC
jgi:hypothetical protein